MAFQNEDNTGGNACYMITKAGRKQGANRSRRPRQSISVRSVAANHALAVHPSYVPTNMTGFYGEDDMDACMSDLVNLLERLGTDLDSDLPNRGFVQ
jgi:hypothetical protein